MWFPGLLLALAALLFAVALTLRDMWAGYRVPQLPVCPDSVEVK